MMCVGHSPVQTRKIGQGQKELRDWETCFVIILKSPTHPLPYFAMSCPICLEHYSLVESFVPRVFPCGHTFCTSCLQKLLDFPGKKPLQCPICRNEQRKFRKVESYPKNYGLLDELGSRARRILTPHYPERAGTPPDDETYCSSFSPLTLDIPVVCPPSLSTLPVPPPIMCSQHPTKPHEFYDENCHMFVCSHCIALGQHHGHKCVSIEDFQIRSQEQLRKIEENIPSYLLQLSQGQLASQEQLEHLERQYADVQSAIDSQLADRPELRKDLLHEANDQLTTQGEKIKIHLRKLKDLEISMTDLLEFSRKWSGNSTSNTCVLSILDQLGNSFDELKATYDGLKSFFKCVSDDYDWSAHGPMNPSKPEFAFPGEPCIRYIPLPETSKGGVILGPITGTGCVAHYQKALEGDEHSLEQLRVMSQNCDSFFASGYYIIALHILASPQLETVQEKVNLIPTLQEKHQRSILKKDEAYILSQLYKYGIGCPVNEAESSTLARLSEELISKFRHEPEIKSRERLISLHLQLLEHSSKCKSCSSKNCNKIKVSASSPT